MSDAVVPSTYQFSFASPRGGRGRKVGTARSRKKPRPKFVPSDRQVLVARRRIVGYLRRQGVAQRIPDDIRLDQLAGSIAYQLHNRGGDLGDLRKGEARLTVLAALQQMIDCGDVVVDEGYLALMCPMPKKREHHQKYPPRRKRMRRNAA